VKVILREDVEKLGERGQVVNVASGYARNFLLPKGLAMAATPGNLKTLELQRKIWEAKEIHEVEEARAFADRIEGEAFAVVKKAGESETLYGSVTSSEIAELLAAKGFEVDRKKIQLDEPIKKLGEFSVPLKLHRQVTAEIKLKVLPEDE
jgi:large subunit ribosomal protein L9